MKYEAHDNLTRVEEFDQVVKLVEKSEDVPKSEINLPSKPSKEDKMKMEPKDSTVPIQKDISESSSQKKSFRTKKLRQKKSLPKGQKAQSESETSMSPQLTREPEIEDSEGFNGRRPIVDPFKIGEKVIHKIYYDSALFNLPAGTLTFGVSDFVEVNGRKSYKFTIDVKSSDWFSSYYMVEDRVETMLDYELFVPLVFQLHVKEKNQLKEGRSFFDFKSNQAIYWEKKVTEKNGVEEKKQQWEILPFSQNVFSAIFYMRLFKWQLDKEYSFRVADDGENLIFKAKTLKKENLKTELGVMPAIKVKPEFSVKGVFKPVGDIYIWMSDDDRKYILRIESKIKVGTLVSEVDRIIP